MRPAQLAAVSYLARYTGATHRLYAYELRRWFSWCEINGVRLPGREVRRRLGGWRGRSGFGARGAVLG
jgi:hypothetical protein